MKSEAPRLKVFRGTAPGESFMDSARTSAKLSAKQVASLLEEFFEWLTHPGRAIDQVGRSMAMKVGVNEDLSTTAFLFYATMIRRAARLRLPQEDLRRDLQELHLDSSVIDVVVKEYAKHKETILRKILLGISLPTVTELSWRADLAISGGDILDEPKPVVLLEVHYSDANDHKSVIFEFSRSKLEYLREVVTEALGVMPQLEKQQLILRRQAEKPQRK